MTRLDLFDVLFGDALVGKMGQEQQRQKERKKGRERKRNKCRRSCIAGFQLNGSRIGMPKGKPISDKATRLKCGASGDVNFCKRNGDLDSGKEETTSRPISRNSN